MTTELFFVRYRPAVNMPAMQLLCQLVDLPGGRRAAWIDGRNVNRPVLLPIKPDTSITSIGSFETLVAEQKLLAGLILDVAPTLSITLIARAIKLMEADRKVSAEDAVDLVIAEAQYLSEADQIDRARHESSTGSMGFLSLAAA